jgi:hypothetical protein
MREVISSGLEWWQALQVFLDECGAVAWWLEPKTTLSPSDASAGFASTSLEALRKELPDFDELWVWATEGRAFHAVRTTAEAPSKIVWARFDGVPPEATGPLRVRMLAPSDRYRLGLLPGACPGEWLMRHAGAAGYLWLQPQKDPQA